MTIQIVDAMPVSPGKPGLDRDAGFVKFHICRRENNYCREETYALSQDNFVRFLITGELPESSEK